MGASGGIPARLNHEPRHAAVDDGVGVIAVHVFQEISHRGGRGGIGQFDRNAAAARLQIHNGITRGDGVVGEVGGEIQRVGRRGAERLGRHRLRHHGGKQLSRLQRLKAKKRGGTGAPGLFARFHTMLPTDNWSERCRNPLRSDNSGGSEV